MIDRRLILAGLAATAALGMPARGRAAGRYDPGASDTEVKVGNTTAYSGPISQFGAIGRAMTACFAQVNDAGGVNGRRITLLSADDAYSPPKTVEATRRLVEQDGVLFLAGGIGTPTQTAVQRYLNTRKVPQLFILGGSSKWGKPAENPWSMGWSPTYAAEAEIYAKYALAAKPDAKIGVLYANDDFGRDYLDGFKKGLGPHAGRIVSAVTVMATDPTVDSQVLALQASGCDVLLNAGPGKTASQAIRKAGELGWKPLHFVNNNSAGVDAFIKPAGFQHAQGLVTAQYRKDPVDPVWAEDPGVVAWKAWMAKYCPEASLTDEFYTHGYSVAQTVVQVIRQCGDDLTRENVMRQAADLRSVALPLLLPGIVLKTSATDFYPMQSMRLSRFAGERWQLFGDTIGAED